MLLKFLLFFVPFIVDCQKLNSIKNNHERKLQFSKYHSKKSSSYRISGETAHIFDGLGALSGGGATSRFKFNFLVYFFQNFN